MADSSDMPKKTVTPTDSKKQTTKKGPHGGGNSYNQANLAKQQFAVHNPIPGHTQSKNVE